MIYMRTAPKIHNTPAINTAEAAGRQSNATRGTRSKMVANTSEVLSGCMKRGANGTRSSVHPTVHAVAECRRSGGTPSRRRSAFSALTAGACARKKRRQRPRLSRSDGCCKAKAYSWKRPETAKASAPAAHAGTPRRVSGEKTVRRKSPWMSRFQRRPG